MHRNTEIQVVCLYNVSIFLRKIHLAISCIKCPFVTVLCNLLRNTNKAWIEEEEDVSSTIEVRFLALSENRSQGKDIIFM